MQITRDIKGRWAMGNKAFEGHHHSEQTKYLLSEKNKRRHFNPVGEFRKGELVGSQNPFYGHKHTDEAKQKNREKHLGKHINRSHRESLIDKDGYKWIWVGRGYTETKQSYILEHRYVIQQKLGRKLLFFEHVHHIDGNRLNNLPENLMVVTPQTHAACENCDLRMQIKLLKWHVKELQRQLCPQLFGGKDD